MKSRRILSALLAGALAASMSVSAFAADNDATSLTQNTALSGELAMPTVKITVPSTGKVFLNPYQIKVDTVGTPTDPDDDITDQVLSVPLSIKSETNSALKVGVSVAGTVGGAAKLVAAPIEQTDTAATANNVFMYLDLVNCGVDNPADDWTAVKWSASFDATKHAVVSASTTKPNALEDVITIPECVDNEPQYAAFRITGNTVKVPKTAWTAADKVDVAVAFTFTPTAS